jgi:riboflavin biosynthesis pyrimidine reductase
MESWYLAFLQDKGISYVFAGKKADDLDLPLALEKLRTKFGIKKLLLEGGGETNGEFLRTRLPLSNGLNGLIRFEP